MFARYAVFVMATTILPAIGSALMFVASPQSFYYRPWEYFEEIGYRHDGAALSWSGAETGDLSRDTVLFRQQGRPTRVTTTAEGYRVTPDTYGEPRILVLGDSLIFGSGLSDDETMPWRLSQRLGAGVFNGARRGGLCLLDWLEHASLEVVVEVHTERFVTPAEVASRTTCVTTDGMIERHPVPLAIADVPARRYLYPLTATRAVKAAAKDMAALVRSSARRALEAPEVHGAPVDEAALAAAIEAIAAVKARLEARGIRYVFAAVPSSRTIHGSWDGADAAMATFHARLAAGLGARGVATLDLEAVMRTAAAEPGERLFQPYDTHWSPRGADRVAAAFAEEIRAGGGFGAVTAASE